MHPNPYDNLLPLQSLAPVARTASANGTSIDRAQSGADFQDALVIVSTGAITDGTHTVAVQESDDNSTFTAVADADLQGTEPAIGQDDDNAVFVIGYVGSARYLRVAVTVAGASTGGVYGATVVLANPRNAPVDHS
jgi:hypothetical protein